MASTAIEMIETTTANASEELEKAEDLLKRYKKKSTAQRNKLDPGEFPGVFA